MAWSAEKIGWLTRDNSEFSLDIFFWPITSDPQWCEDYGFWFGRNKSRVPMDLTHFIRRGEKCKVFLKIEPVPIGSVSVADLEKDRD